MAGQVVNLRLALGQSVTSYPTNFPIGGIRIDNPGPSFILIEDAHIICPPFTLGWYMPLVQWLQTISIKQILLPSPPLTGVVPSELNNVQIALYSVDSDVVALTGATSGVDVSGSASSTNNTLGSGSDFPTVHQYSVSAANAGLTHVIGPPSSAGITDPITSLFSYAVLVYYLRISRIATTQTIFGTQQLIITTNHFDLTTQISPATEFAGISWRIGDAIALGATETDVEIGEPDGFFTSRIINPGGSPLIPSVTVPAAGAGVIWVIESLSRILQMDATASGLNSSGGGNGVSQINTQQGGSGSSGIVIPTPFFLDDFNRTIGPVNMQTPNLNWLGIASCGNAWSKTIGDAIGAGVTGGVDGTQLFLTTPNASLDGTNGAAIPLAGTPVPSAATEMFLLGRFKWTIAPGTGITSPSTFSIGWSGGFPLPSVGTADFFVEILWYNGVTFTQVKVRGLTGDDVGANPVTFVANSYFFFKYHTNWNTLIQEAKIWPDDGSPEPAYQTSHSVGQPANNYHGLSTHIISVRAGPGTFNLDFLQLVSS